MRTFGRGPRISFEKSSWFGFCSELFPLLKRLRFSAFALVSQEHSSSAAAILRKILGFRRHPYQEMQHLLQPELAWRASGHGPKRGTSRETVATSAYDGRGYEPGRATCGGSLVKSRPLGNYVAAAGRDVPRSVWGSPAGAM